MCKVSWAVVFGFTFLLLSDRTDAQSDNAHGKENDLYAMALVASISEMQKQWGHIDDGFGNRMRTDYEHMIVVQNPEITDELPTDFGSHRLDYLSNQELVNRYKASGKEFSVLQIHPIHADGASLRIQVSVAWFSYGKKGMLFGYSDWSDVEFKFDCAQQAFTISNVKLGGI